MLMFLFFDGLVSDILKAGPSIPYLGLVYDISGSDGVSPKGKRKLRQEEDEDYREFPQKKHKLYGNDVTWLVLPLLGTWALLFEGERL